MYVLAKLTSVVLSHTNSGMATSDGAHQIFTLARGLDCMVLFRRLY